MTIQEMHIAVITQLEQVASYSFADFKPEEIDYYINRSISKWLRAKQSVIRDSEQSSPELVSISEDIYTLLKTVIFNRIPGPTEGTLSNSGIYENASIAQLSTIPDDDFYLYVLSRTQIDGEWKNNRLVTPTDFIGYTQTASDQPYFRNPPVTIQGNNLLVLRSVEDVLINSFVLLYIKTPDKVLLDRNTPANSVNSDLPEHVHDDIVDLTVQSMLTDIRVQGE